MTVQTKDVQITREGFDDFIASLKYPPNQFQRDILESIAFGDGNLMVNALAGSGKTSLLVMTADLFHKMGIKDVMYLAFNVSIRNELNERLPHGYSAVNSHSLGNNLIKQHLKSNARLGKWKLSDIAKETIEKHGGAFLSKWELYTLGRRLEGITSKVMLNNVNPADHASVMSTAEFFGYGDDEESDKESPISISDLCAMVPRVIDASWQRFQATGEITFDEMLYYPVKHIDPDAFPKHDWVLVDECQDLNALQQIIAMRSVRETGRILLVGDIRQAIYLFSGADARSFDNMIEMTNAKVLPLNICYRCPTSHLNLARSIVPQILPRDGAPEGQVKYIKPDQMPDVSEPGTMILSRTKAPLLSAYFVYSPHASQPLCSVATSARNSPRP